jgi:hypothetical protein
MMVEVKTRYQKQVVRVMLEGLAMNLNILFVMNMAEGMVVYKLMESQNLMIITMKDKFVLLQVKVMELELKFQQEPDLCRGGDKSLRLKMRPGQ